MRNIKLLYFSATGTTKRIVGEIGNAIGKSIAETRQPQNLDFTLPKKRREIPIFSDKDIVVVGVPVYAGRIPNVLLKYLNSIKGQGAIAIPIVVYGNRNYDDALIELKDLLEVADFKVIAAGAFIGEHSFSNTLAKGRPDLKDLIKAKEFAEKIGLKLEKDYEIKPLLVRGNKDYSNYYAPLGQDGKTKDIRKVVPKTKDFCIDCKLCAEICPMGSINYDDVSQIIGICIKCGACVKKCPVGAKYFDDPDFLFHKKDLEDTFKERREPELFL